MEFRSRAVRSLVELHEVEIRRFLQTWARFVESGAPMPEAHGDDSYASRDALGAHVMKAARGYLTRIGEWVERPVTDVDASTDDADIASRMEPFAEHVLEAYRRHLVHIAPEQVDPQVHRARWGDLMSIDILLEHAVVHPMRHRIQLERLIEASASARA